MPQLTWFILAFALAISAGWIIYLVRRIPQSARISSTRLLLTGATGALVAIPAGLLGIASLSLFDLDPASASQLTLALHLILGVGLVEELAKWVAARFGAQSQNPDLGQQLLLASAAAAGFMFMENLLAWLGPLGQSSARELFTILILRTATSPVHIALASLWGSAQGSRVWLWLAVAALLHGSYDFFLLTGQVTVALAIFALILALFGLRIAQVRRNWIQA